MSEVPPFFSEMMERFEKQFDKIDKRLGKIEQRLGKVEQGLGRVESEVHNLCQTVIAMEFKLLAGPERTASCLTGRIGRELIPGKSKEVTT